MKIILIFIIFSAFVNAGYYDYSDVLLVANSQSSISMNISDYFFSQRNMIYRVNISVADAETINFTVFSLSVRNPIEDYLLENNLTYKINYIVLTKGVPLRIQNPIGGPCSSVNSRCASVDSELTLILSKFSNSIGESNK